MSRLRIIAGPNGSGKTTLTNFLRVYHNLNFGYYINADEIESLLQANNKISFRRFGLKIQAEAFNSFFNQHSLLKHAHLPKYEIRRNTLYLLEPLKDFSYFSAAFADFLRQQLLELKETFSFETVMSGKDKVNLIRQAKSND